jgi:chromosome segregation ATPase
MMDTKKDLLDMTQEEVDALTRDQLTDYLQDVGSAFRRIGEELRQLKKEEDDHKKRMAEFAARREKNKLKFEAARKRDESNFCGM